MQGQQAPLTNLAAGKAHGWNLITLLLPVLLVGCDVPATTESPAVSGAAEPPVAAVTGTLTYRERMALSPAASAIVELQDVSRTDVAATTLVSIRLESPGNPPIPFQLDYDPAQLEEGMRYAVRAEIREGERLLFTTAERYEVLTGDAAAQDLEILLVRAQEPVASEENQPLTGTRWVLETMVGDSGGQAPAALPGEERPPSLEFTADRVSGYSGCNGFNGGYDATDGSLTIGLLAITQRACPDMMLERAILTGLGEADAYLLDAEAQTLTLVASGKPTLIYRRVLEQA
ncbi:MAG: YbaY family lipoprotein [Pseudomonadota bacterium]